LIEAAPTLLDSGAQLVVLGAGDRSLEDGFAALASANPGRIGCRFGYHEDLAHGVYAGVDAVLMPSRFEPCGLTQLCAMRYGAVPVAAKVGGLGDTIVDPGPSPNVRTTANGLLFSPTTRDALELALRRTARLWDEQRIWKRLQRQGLKTDVSWTRSAEHYAQPYRTLILTNN
jgi:starch synthase